VGCNETRFIRTFNDEATVTSHGSADFHDFSGVFAVEHAGFGGLGVSVES